MRNRSIFLTLSRILMTFGLILFTVSISSCDYLNSLLDDMNTSLGADSFESNDTWQTASSIALVSTYQATLDDDSDVDFYQFTTAHGSDTYDKIEFALETSSADLLFRFEIYNTNGEKLLYENANTPGQNLTYTAACPGGTYLFRISGWNATMDSDNGSHGSYSFTINNLYANDAQAPNQGKDAATSVAFGTVYNGVIVSKGEDDWYKATNAQSDRWDYFQMNITNVSESLAAGYYIENAEGTVIYDNTSATSSFTEGANQIYTFASKSSEFYFKVCGWDNVMHGAHGSTGDYSFEIIDMNANDTYEPDDTLDTAQDVTTFPTTIDGTVIVDATNDNGGDFECFKVSIANGKTISWSVDPAASNTEFHFKVYDWDESYIDLEDGDDGETIQGSMGNSTGSDSVFYIKLGAYVGDTGDYTISFTES